ncbi:MAG: efflux RND transporter periplasmic adaptor subunit [Deltaproteobacteria bacterium]|nr:efflux RND transporter periplasmic adaptor subunit [Deltaproteobacteria bacterium]
MFSRHITQTVLFIVAGLSLTACRKPAPVKDKSVKPSVAHVQIQKVVPQIWRQTIRTFGRIEAAEKVTISSEISGKINDVLFNEGDQIEAGQKLVSFDVAESRMQLKQAEGNLSGISARLQEARDMLSRREGLFKQRAISKEQLEGARTSVATLQAQYEQLMAGRNLARQNIRRTQLQSPVQGTVVSKSVDAGEVAMPGQPLAVIHVTDTMRVTTWVTQEEVNTVRTGIECKVTTNGVRGRTWKAHVESVGTEADPVTGNFPVKLTVNNTDGLLKAGMSAMVTLTGLEMNDAILIPDIAVVDRNRKRVVFLEDNGKAREVEPILSATTGTVRQVLHGLSNGDRVIVGGLDDVADGSSVKVMGTVPFKPAMSEINGSNEIEAAPDSTTDTPNATDNPQKNQSTRGES